MVKLVPRSQLSEYLAGRRARSAARDAIRLQRNPNYQRTSAPIRIGPGPNAFGPVLRPRPPQPIRLHPQPPRRQPPIPPPRRPPLILNRIRIFTYPKGNGTGMYAYLNIQGQNYYANGIQRERPRNAGPYLHGKIYLRH